MQGQSYEMEKSKYLKKNDSETNPVIKTSHVLMLSILYYDEERYNDLTKTLDDFVIFSTNENSKKLYFYFCIFLSSYK